MGTYRQGLHESFLFSGAPGIQLLREVATPWMCRPTQQLALASRRKAGVLLLPIIPG